MTQNDGQIPSTEEDWRNLKPQVQQGLTNLALHAEVLIQDERERDWLPLMRNKSYELGVHDDVKDSELQSYLDAAERRADKAVITREAKLFSRKSQHSFLMGCFI